jgi:hypothetical protein
MVHGSWTAWAFRAVGLDGRSMEMEKGGVPSVPVLYLLLMSFLFLLGKQRKVWWSGVGDG